MGVVRSAGSHIRDKSENKMRPLFLIVVLFLATAAWAGGVTGGDENLVPNPGFEEGDGKVPAHWSGGDPGPHGDASWGTESHSGKRCLVQSVDDHGEAVVWWSCDLFSVQPGETYTVSVWYRCANSAAGPPVVQIQDETGKNLIDWNLPVRDTWQEFRQSFTLPPDIDRLRVSLINFHRAGQRIVWDDVRLFDTFAAAGMKTRTVPVARGDARQTAIADRPYELGDRAPDYPPSIMFSDLRGWTMRLRRGALGTAAVSAQQRIWGEQCLRVTYRAGNLLPKGTPFLGTSGALHRKPVPGGCTLEIVPPKPIEIENPFDAIQMWVNGDNYYSKYVPQVTIRLLDGDGATTDIRMGPVNWMYWFLMYAPVPRTLTPPVRFDRILLTNITNPEPLDIYFDALAFVEAPKTPVKVRKWKDPLPFPTREETILPTVRKPVTNHVRRDGRFFVLDCETTDGPVTYRYEAKTGTLSDISALVPNEGTWQPLYGGGPVVLDKGPINRDGLATRLISARIRGDAVVSEWRVTGDVTPFSLTYVLRARGKSLVIDVKANRPRVSSFSAGRIVGAPDPRVFWVPYMNICRWPQPHILITRGHFASIYFDWYNTESSAFYGAGSVSDEGARIFDRARYEPTPEGTSARHCLRERIFLTISNHVDEVFFSIPNPPSPLKDILRTNLLVSRQHYGGGVRDYADSEFPFWRHFKAYGVDHLTIRLHADFWRSRETFTLKDQAAPAKGGDRVAKEYIRNLKSLGYRVGLYTDYLLISPLSESWTPDMAALNPDGDRGEQAFATYFLKPVQAPGLEAEWAARIHRKFGTSASYCDQMTQANLGWIDFDPRVPGGTQQKTTFENWGRVLLNERVAHHGPCYSEGGYSALWAGLVDGSYAQTFQPDAPPVPDFALLKLHPLQADVGYDLGVCDGSDRQIAMQIVYGNGGMLWAGPWGSEVKDFDVPGMLRCYFMMQQLQYRYTMEPIERIRYFNGTDLVDSDAALRSGAFQRGQVMTVYRNGLITAVNANRKGNWTLVLGDREMVLPPFGWVAKDSRGFFEYSALFDGKRRDFVQSDEVVYFDGRGVVAREGGIETAGQAIVLRSHGVLRVIPVDPTTPIRLNPAMLNLARTRQITLEYTTDTGAVVSVEKRAWPADGWLVPKRPEGFFALQISAP